MYFCLRFSGFTRGIITACTETPLNIDFDNGGVTKVETHCCIQVDLHTTCNGSNTETLLYHLYHIRYIYVANSFTLLSFTYDFFFINAILFTSEVFKSLHLIL